MKTTDKVGTGLYKLKLRAKNRGISEEEFDKIVSEHTVKSGGIKDTRDLKGLVSRLKRYAKEVSPKVKKIEEIGVSGIKSGVELGKKGVRVGIKGVALAKKVESWREKQAEGAIQQREKNLRILEKRIALAERSQQILVKREKLKEKLQEIRRSRRVGRKKSINF